ncbi:MAG: hypothetical protein AUK44_07080 [Porphyromonadaceae bacterium CG2_30_38_12]|nr:MAG: hypothetical protein AUK44_07080 [Porphyromonadaceae bacterium CG2_30_38_12]
MLACIFVPVSIQGQTVQTLYFLENTPVRHTFNPAIQPLSSFYLGLPITGFTQVGFGNNSFTVSSLVLSKTDLFNTIKPVTLLHTDAQINLIGFGFRHKNSYWNFNATAKSSLRLGLPKDLFKFALFGNVNDVNGNPQLYNNVLDLQKFSIGLNAYLEGSVGYSRLINEKWSVGVKLKYLHGLGTSTTTFSRFEINSGIDQLKLNFNTDTKSSYIDYQGANIFKPAGMGGAVDVGVIYRPFHFLTIGAAVNDLGFISWTKNINQMNINADYQSSSVSNFSFNDILNGVQSNSFTFNLAKDIYKTIQIDSLSKPFQTSLSPTANLSAEYAFWNNSFSIGLLSSSLFYGKDLYQDVTAAFNVRPTNWFNGSISYSLFNGKASNIGAALGIRIGFINTFVSADYIPLNYTPLQTPLSFGLLNPSGGSVAGSPSISKVPYKTDRFNFAVGFNIVFGNKQDNDKDGISNHRDKCPDTPHGVIVDKKGCPLDADGDGIPDYIDKCPDTPKEAYKAIDSDGCPLDSDGDGVPDYLDKCPDTPEAERHTVDSVGCTVKTTETQAVEIQAPIVAAVSPTTSPAVTNIETPVDSFTVNPTATKTPIEAQVPDKDTDGDGIIDKLDRCPELAGVALNGGCPEIKKEVQVVFQKALQGIQFERAKFIIKPLSYVILDHVARVLNENPTYLVEIQGHTDNEGKAETNLKLSNNRANVVRDYLISKGIDASRLSANGYGDTRPIAPNTSAINKAKNRRVEFIVSF